jgi:hypothetical protein
LGVGGCKVLLFELIRKPLLQRNGFLCPPAGNEESITSHPPSAGVKALVRIRIIKILEHMQIFETRFSTSALIRCTVGRRKRIQTQTKAEACRPSLGTSLRHPCTFLTTSDLRPVIHLIVQSLLRNCTTNMRLNHS